LRKNLIWEFYRFKYQLGSILKIIISAVLFNSNSDINGYLILLSISSILLVFGGKAPVLVALIFKIFSPFLSLYLIFFWLIFCCIV